MRNLPEVTGLRGVAALIVVGYHALVIYTLMGPGYPSGITASLSRHGWIGVDLFFVLSGFLLCLPFLRRPEALREKGFWKAYVLKRWLRIAPSYYISILAVLLVFNRVAYLDRGVEDIVMHAFYLHNLKPEYLFSVNPVYWSLAVEFQFYLILPFLAYLMARRSWVWTTLALFGASLAWRFTTYDASDPAQTTWISSQLPGFLGHFALGAATARLYLTGWKFQARANLIAAGALLVFVVLPLQLLFQTPDPVPTPYTQQSQAAVVLLRPLLAVGFAALILMTRDSAMLRRVLSLRPARQAGTISYSVYLIHLPINLWVASAYPATMSLGFVPYLAVSFLAALPGCALFYVLVERPFLRVKARVTDRSRAPSTPTPRAPSPIAASAVVLEAF